mmetsp:Transcript_15545/g.40310  ORF Transcript_15545/g.40310 Transcript_15545/m.40310 type:complete len:381 (+) Transcript_15545:387-1529(+)
MLRPYAAHVLCDCPSAPGEVRIGSNGQLLPLANRLFSASTRQLFVLRAGSSVRYAGLPEQATSEPHPGTPFHHLCSTFHSVSRVHSNQSCASLAAVPGCRVRAVPSPLHPAVPSQLAGVNRDSLAQRLQLGLERLLLADDGASHLRLPPGEQYWVGVFLGCKLAKRRVAGLLRLRKRFTVRNVLFDLSLKILPVLVRKPRSLHDFTEIFEWMVALGTQDHTHLDAIERVVQRAGRLSNLVLADQLLVLWQRPLLLEVALHLALGALVLPHVLLERGLEVSERFAPEPTRLCHRLDHFVVLGDVLEVVNLVLIKRVQLQRQVVGVEHFVQRLLRRVPPVLDRESFLLLAGQALSLGLYKLNNSRLLGKQLVGRASRGSAFS